MELPKLAVAKQRRITNLNYDQEGRQARNTNCSPTNDAVATQRGIGILD
jgi:hypothetical protein